ncbi:hypothetical protein SLEP1_g28103 [Rubroshorea leprosula]|uniref:Uncharacterized protein n=1 Tax=Rubroshorea leprosula TaxID=152421 RepID=A0AAV5K410_9ROSI|nr:hypothetical protein SLEP1_g28103 [Rubroshorea leprosula]
MKNHQVAAGGPLVVTCACGAVPDGQQQPRPTFDDNSISLYHIFIAMVESGLTRFTPSRLGELMGVLFQFHVVCAPAMDEASHYCPSGYGKAIHDKRKPVNPSSWELLGINYRGSGLVGMDRLTLPFWRSKAFVLAKLGTSDVARFRQKRLGSKGVETNLIPRTISFDANQRLEILLKTD